MIRNLLTAILVAGAICTAGIAASGTLARITCDPCQLIARLVGR